MTKVREGLITIILVAGFVSFTGYDFFTPVKCDARDEKAVKEEKAGKENKAATEAKASQEAKKAPKASPAKKVVKKALAPVVTIATPVATLAKGLAVTVLGTGYEPGQELRVLFTDAEGMQTNINYALSPPPTGNKVGAWSSNWAVDDFIKANLVTAGVFTLTVVDGEYKPLAQTAIVFKEAPKAEAGGKKSGDEKKSGEKGEKKTQDK